MRFAIQEDHVRRCVCIEAEGLVGGVRELHEHIRESISGAGETYEITVTMDLDDPEGSARASARRRRINKIAKAPDADGEVYHRVDKSHLATEAASVRSRMVARGFSETTPSRVEIMRPVSPENPRL